MATPELVSFDVFDTLVTRAVGAPTSLFLLLGRLPDVRAITGLTPEELARLRAGAERRALRGRSEVTLAQIHAELAAGLGLDPAQAKELLEAELAIERRLSRPVPFARALLDGAPAVRRVAVSDMYLPGAVIEDLLDRHGLREPFDRVYVSSEHGARKRTGALFHHVQRVEAVAPAAWWHVGDDPLADYRVPRRLGITTRPVGDARLNRYEHVWEDHRWETSGLSSLLAGGSRLARLAMAPTAEQEPVVRVAAGVAAPVLTAYVLWVLNAAARESIERLYFLARDGQILYEIALRLRDRLGLDLDLRYLYGSRQAFGDPACREAAQRYLREQGLADGASFAIVDNGWGGGLLQSMHELLEPLGSGVSRAFFLGHRAHADGFHRPVAISGYLFDEHAGTGCLDFVRPLWWLGELFCAADHGTTVGFAGAPVEPVLADADNPLLRRWPWWQLYRRTVLTFVEQCVWDADLANIQADLRGAVADVLAAFWEWPDQAEAACWGAFPVEDPGTGAARPPARPVGLGTIATRLRGGDTDVVWPRASLRLAAPPLRWAAGAGFWCAARAASRRRGRG